MLRFFKRLFVPTRFDATCFVIAIHWVLAILSVLLLPAFAQSAGVHQADAVIVVAAATILAIAATIGWKVNSRRRMLALLSSSIASLGFVIGWCCFNADYLRAQTKTSVYRMPQSPFDADLFLGHTFWMLCWIIVVALIVLAGNWIVPRIFMAMKSPSSWLGRKFGDDRTRTLVFIAAGLFALAIAGRVLQSIGMGFDSNGVGSAFTLAMGLLGYSLLWAITLYWFPRSFVFNGKPVQKLVSFLLMLLVAVPVFANAIQNFAVTFEDVIQLVGGVVFVLSVIGVGGEQSEVAADSNQAADSHQAENEVVRKARVVSWPSLFSVAAVAMLAATLAMPWFIDLGILAMPYRSGVSSVRRLQLAVESARVRRERGF